MIYLKDLLIDENIISEGIYKTYSVKESLPILNRLLSTNSYNMEFFDKNNRIEVKFNHNNPKVNKDLSKSDFEFLLLNMRTLGYHPSYYKQYDMVFGWKKYDENEIEKILNLKDGYGIYFMVFDASHTDKIIDSDELPDTVYHITPTINKENIEKKGLCPKSKNKFEIHPERIYFVVDIEGIRSLLKNKDFITNKHTNNPYEKMTIFEFDLKLYKEKSFRVRFCEDTSFKIHGIFTNDNIHSKYLKVVRDLTYVDGIYKE